MAPLGTGHVADQNAGSSKPGLYFTLVMVVGLATGNSTHPRTHSPSTMGSLLKGYWGVGNPLYGLSLEMYWPFWASDTDQSLQPTTVNCLWPFLRHVPMSAPTQWPPLVGVGRRGAMFWSTAKTVTSTSSPPIMSVKVRVAPSGCGTDGPALVVVSAEGSLLLEQPESMREMATPNVTRSVRVMRNLIKSFPAPNSMWRKQPAAAGQLVKALDLLRSGRCGGAGWPRCGRWHPLAATLVETAR